MESWHNKNFSWCEFSIKWPFLHLIQEGNMNEINSRKTSLLSSITWILRIFWIAVSIFINGGTNLRLEEEKLSSGPNTIRKLICDLGQSHCFTMKLNLILIVQLVLLFTTFASLKSSNIWLFDPLSFLHYILLASRKKS